MLLNEEGDQHFTDKNFRDTLLNFLIAGRDTTAVTLSWFVYMMTLHPHIAQKIFEELRKFEDLENAVNRADIDKECLGEEQFNQKIVTFSELLKFDSLQKLTYLHACILETLRLYPAVPMVMAPTQTNIFTLIAVMKPCMYGVLLFCCALGRR